MSIINITTKNNFDVFLNESINKLIFLLLVFLPISNPIGQTLVNGFKLNPNILLWKELILFILMILMLIKIFFYSKNVKVKYIFVCILLLILIGTSTISNKIELKNILIGFKFELYWLCFLAVGYDWTLNGGFLKLKEFLLSIYLGLVAVISFTSLSIFFGAERFYTFLNYKDGGEDNNIVNSLYCHSINGLGDGCRLSGGFNNPNHFAAYLMLTIPVIIYFMFCSKSIFTKFINFLIFFILSNFLWLNYSRFAWLAIIICTILSLPYFTKIRIPKLKFLLNSLIILTMILSIFVSFWIFLKPFNSTLNNQLPYYLSKQGSTETHYKLTNISIDIIKKNLPNIIYKGYGIGQSGPAAKQDYVDVATLKIVKENIEIADKYMITSNSIPIPENWYLQLILNGGFIYFLLYIVLLLAPFINICNTNGLSFFLMLSLFSIIFGNMFLHLWESSIIAMYFSIYAIYAFQNDRNKIKTF